MAANHCSRGSRPREHGRRPSETPLLRWVAEQPRIRQPVDARRSWRRRRSPVTSSASSQSRHAERVFGVILATAIVPFEVYMIPLYFQVQAIGLLNSIWGLLIGYLVMSFGIFLIRQNVIHRYRTSSSRRRGSTAPASSGSSSASSCRCCAVRWGARRARLLPGLDGVRLAADRRHDARGLYDRGRAWRCSRPASPSISGGSAPPRRSCSFRA